MAKILGIDLGTTNSCASIYEDNEMRVLHLEPNQVTLPSVVRFTNRKLDEVSVGTSAKRMVLIKPDEVFASVKSLMRDEEWKSDDSLVDKFTIEDKLLTPTDISAIILKEIIRLVKENNEYNEPIEECVICVPANSTVYKQHILEAAIQAGLGKRDDAGEIIRDKKKGNPLGIYLLEEPTAAAIAYAQDKGFFEEGKKLGSVLLVYDFGGGTFDVTILEVAPPKEEECNGRQVILPQFNVLSTKGISDLGGDKIDYVLMEIVAKQFYDQYDIDLLDPKKENRGNSPAKVKLAQSVLKEMAEGKKIEFSLGADAVQFEHNCLIEDMDNEIPCKLDIVVKREEFIEAITPLIESSLKCTEEALTAAHKNIDDINRIILVGGSSKAPWVRDAISKRFREPYNPKNQDTIVAMGAARYGQILQGNESQTTIGQDEGIEEGSRPVPPINGITTHHYGLELQGGYFSPLVEKGLKFDAEHLEHSYTAIYSNPNDSGKIKIAVWATQEELSIIEKNGIKIASLNVHAQKDNRPIFEYVGEYEVTIPIAPKGELQIEISLCVSSENIVSVKAKIGDNEPQLAEWKI